MWMDQVRRRAAVETRRIVRTPAWLAVALCAIGGLSAGVAQGQAADTNEIAATLREFDANPANRADARKRLAFIENQLSVVDFNAAPLPTLAPLVPYIRESEKLTAKFDARLAAFSADRSLDGFTALVVRTQLVRDSAKPEDRLALLREIAQHAALREALATRTVDGVFQFARTLRGEDLKPAAPVILQIIGMFDDNTGATTLTAAIPILRDLVEADIEKSKVHAAMDRVAGWLDIVAMKVEEEAKAIEDPKRRADATRGATRFTSAAELLRGPALRGTLLGNTAPAVDFEWVSGDRKWKSLADLKGNVVVLDFWATWCGPCVGSFPNVRKLVERYNGFPVVVLGVTSLQGYHQQKGKRTDCADDPQKEYGLMPGFMDVMEVIWPIAFSKQRVFNPQFGVQGIPHVALIGPDGKVALNGMRIGPDIREECEKIDALLKAAGLPAPPPLVEESKPESREGEQGAGTTTVVVPAPPK